MFSFLFFLRCVSNYMLHPAKDEDEVAYKITALSRKHRAVLIAVYVMRLAVQRDSSLSCHVLFGHQMDPPGNISEYIETHLIFCC